MLIRKESVLESFMVKTMVFRGQEALSTLVVFARARNTVMEARASVLHLPLARKVLLSPLFFKAR